MKIYLATDHAGFEMKEAIRLFLENEKENLLKEMEKKLSLVIPEIQFVDFGAYKYEKGDDYPKYIGVCAGQLSGDIYAGDKNNFAIVFGGSGEGEAMLSDKYQGVRAGVINCENLEIVKLLREHNNANILSLGARFVGLDFAKEAVKLFLTTKFLEKEKDTNQETRHGRRVEEITDLENKINSKINSDEIQGLQELEKMRQRFADY